VGPGYPGGLTQGPDGEILPVYEAALRYRKQAVPLIIIAGREYGAGSSRDWAAKGPALLGVRAIVAESFERIHRSNLIGLGILPLQFAVGWKRNSFCGDGTERFDLVGLEAGFVPGWAVSLVVHRAAGEIRTIPVLLRIETELEAEYLRQGGLLPRLFRNHVPLVAHPS
jgi:aconitate hydratase